MVEAAWAWRCLPWPVRATVTLVVAGLCLLTGCARPLKPLPETPALSPCEVQDKRCLELGKQRFAAYRQAKPALIQQRSEGYRLPGAPQAWLHPQRTVYSVLLIHGLNDSAYYMADIAELLYAQAYND